MLVPGEIDLGELHDVIQTAFGWTNSNLHQFEIGTARYGTLDPDSGMDDVADESRAKLFRLAEEGSRLSYTYDFGDNWDHHVTVEKVLDAQAGTRYPNCSAGRRACPPEDVGGPWGTASSSPHSTTRSGGPARATCAAGSARSGNVARAGGLQRRAHQRSALPQRQGRAPHRADCMAACAPPCQGSEAPAAVRLSPTVSATAPSRQR